MAVAAQPTRPTQKAPVRTPMPSALQQRVARVAVKLATLELMELGVVSALIITARVCVSVCLCLSGSGVWCGRRKYGLFHDNSQQILSSDQSIK